MGNTEEVEKRKRGRPPLGKRGTFTFRVTERLRNLLTAEAEQSRRPVSEIIEQRLEQSFIDARYAELTTTMAPHNVRLARQLMLCAAIIEQDGQPWLNDQEAKQKLIAAATQLIAQVSPENLAASRQLLEQPQKPSIAEGQRIADFVRTPAGMFGPILQEKKP